MNEIILAENAGFCFGVKRAADLTEELIRRRDAGESGIGEIRTLGKLIHNQQYADKLAAAGVGVVGEEELDGLIERAASGVEVTLIIRAHGITRELETTLRASGIPSLHVIDGTCPCVKNNQRIARDFSESEEYGDRLFILIGDEGHPEVRSVVSYSHHGVVVSGAGELTRMYENGALPRNSQNLTVGMAAQTTLDFAEWKKTEEILEKLYTNAKIFDTICSVTESRQREAVRLSAECDMMVVIGGADSSNTAKLFSLCRRECRDACLVQTSADLPPHIRDNIRIGVTAGASTPDYVIGEITQAIKLGGKYTHE